MGPLGIVSLSPIETRKPVFRPPLYKTPNPATFNPSRKSPEIWGTLFWVKDPTIKGTILGTGSPIFGSFPETWDANVVP